MVWLAFRLDDFLRNLIEIRYDIYFSLLEF